jgi:hypothetical protein
MINMRVTRLDHLDPRKIPTKPYERLAFAILLVAVKDLRSKSLPCRLDAARWLIEEAPIYLDAVGLEVDPALWLTSGAKLNEKR